MSGGLMAPMMQMMMARVAGRHMARVLGYAAVPVMLGPILGPVIAGAILQHASWRWLFLVNLPVGALASVLAIFFLPNDREETKPRDLDLVGFALLSPGLVLFLYGSDHVGERIGQITLALSVVLLAMFFKVAVRKGHRALIDLQLFKRKTFAASTVTQFMSNGVELECSATFYAPTIKLPIASSPPRPRTCKRVNSHPPKFNHQLVRRLSRKIRTALSRRRFCGASAATLVAGATNLPLLILKKGLKQ